MPPEIVTVRIIDTYAVSYRKNVQCKKYDHENALF